MNNLFS